MSVSASVVENEKIFFSPNKFFRQGSFYDPSLLFRLYEGISRFQYQILWGLKKGAPMTAIIIFGFKNDPDPDRRTDCSVKTTKVPKNSEIANRKERRKKTFQFKVCFTNPKRSTIQEYLSHKQPDLSSTTTT